MSKKPSALSPCLLVLLSISFSIHPALASDKLRGGDIPIGDAEGSGIALGDMSEAKDSGLALGTMSKAKKSGVALGHISGAGESGVALGDMSEAKESGVAVGRNTTAGELGVSVGSGSNAEDNGVALGTDSKVLAANSVALGPGAEADQEYTVSVGTVGRGRKIVNVAAGTVSAASADAVNGAQLHASAESAANALHASAKSTANALGGGASVDPVNGTIGAPTYSVGDRAVHSVGAAVTNLDHRVKGSAAAIGEIKKTLNTTNQHVDTLDNSIQDVRKIADKNARSMQVNTSSAPAVAEGEGSAALGGGSQALAPRSTAIGEQARATAENAVAIGAGSIANEANTLSIGRDGNERRLSHLAPGVSGTDAVNMNQLNTMHKEIDSKMSDIQRNAYSGIAAAMAMPNLTPSGPGRSVVAAGVGTYEGYSAVAAGITYRTRGGHWLMNGAISVTQCGDMGLRAQAGYEF